MSLSIATIINTVLNSHPHATSTESFEISMANFLNKKSNSCKNLEYVFISKQIHILTLVWLLSSYKLWFALGLFNLKLANSMEKVSFDLVWCSQNVGCSIWMAMKYLPSVQPCMPRGTEKLFKDFIGKRNVENFLKCRSLSLSRYLAYACRNPSEVHRWTQYV